MPSNNTNKINCFFERFIADIQLIWNLQSYYIYEECFVEIKKKDMKKCIAKSNSDGNQNTGYSYYEYYNS